MAVSVALSRFSGDLGMANRAHKTIQQYVASVRRFEEFLVSRRLACATSMGL